MAIKSADQITIVDVTDAYSVSLTADAFTLAGTKDGKASSATTLTTTVQVFRGDTALTSSDVQIGTATAIAGATVTASGLDISIAITTQCTGGVISIPITVDGEVEFTKKISISIAKTGQDGTAAYAYNINASADAVVKDGNTLTPSSITFSATRVQGTGNPAAYSGRFKIEYSSDGSTWSTGYTSSSNESSKAYTIPSGAVLVRCSLYLAGGTSTLLYMKTVPIVAKGTNGTNGTSYYTYVRYSANSDGSSMVDTPTSSTKYIGVYSGTSSSVPAYSQFTWSKYMGDDGDDGADAISITITSSAGTIFKNTTGSTVLTANVFVGGNAATVASNGTVTYGGNTIGTIKWYKGDPENVTGVAGNTCTVTASTDVTSGSLVVTCRLETS